MLRKVLLEKVNVKLKLPDQSLSSEFNSSLQMVFITLNRLCEPVQTIKVSDLGMNTYLKVSLANIMQ